MVKATRQIFFSSVRPFDFGEFQMNYLNHRTQRLIPSTEIFWDGARHYWTNALGCKGEDLEGGRPVVGFFGDSVTHGCGNQSFAEHVRIDGCEALNGGIEGLTLSGIVDRCLEIRDQVPLVCAAVHAGWHNIVYNETNQGHWREQLDRVQGVPVVAHFRLTADINEEALVRGYDDPLVRVHEYALWPGADFATEDARRELKAAIDRFNDFIERYCAERGRILIDLDPELSPPTYADLGAAYVDFLHPRPTAYPAMARKIEAALAPAVAQVLASRTP